MPERPLLVLIDGHAVAYRQFFALRVQNFNTRAGEPTNATYGFTRVLLDILEKEKPEYLAVSFDMGMSGREALYNEYKGTRDKMPDDLSIQMTRINQLVEAFNIPILAVEGYEADDVLGTIACQAVEQGVDVRIVTGDRDILQLLASHIQAQLPQRGGPDVIYDEAGFRDKFDDLEPEQLIDLKALMGDSSDNIPGVKGIGQKGATQLLRLYKTLDGIYENIESIKGATQKKLLEGKEMAYLSRQLATIRRDVPIRLRLKDCVAHDYDVAKVDQLFGELEFRSLRNRLLKQQEDALGQLPLFNIAEKDSGSIEATEEIVPTVTVQDESALNELVTALNKAEAIAWDVETTSTDQMRAELVGIALAVDGEKGYYVPVGHREGRQLPFEMVLNALRPALTNSRIAKYAHNAIYDLIVTRRYGIDVFPVFFDTMIAEWVRDPISRFLGLKNLARQELGISMTEIGELLGSGKKQITMDQVPVEQAAPYAAADAVMVMRLAGFLRDELKKAELLQLFTEMEMPLIPVIADMQMAGVMLNTDYLADMSLRLAAQLDEIEQEIYNLSGGYGRFNINSPKQLNDVLFGKLGLPVEGLQKTTHGYSTDVVTLEILKHQHPIIPYILRHRELSKLKSTYVDALPALVNPETGRVHTSYNQSGSSTGRFSSSNPNLQNIPIRTELGREVRRAFIAAPDRVLLAVDYSQIELRIMAHISQDATLIEAFMQGQDIHRATAATVYGVTPEDVTYEQRNFAKRVNFGLMYGMGAYRLARDSDLTLAEAESFIKTYFERLPGVQEYIENTKTFAREHGYVETLFGRKRRFPNLKAGGSGQRAQAEIRAAINMPIQGTAADILKKAMLQLHERLQQRELQGRMILQVHDELVLEVPEDELDKTARLVVDVMESICELRVPLRANASYGYNWRDMQEIV